MAARCCSSDVQRAERSPDADRRGQVRRPARRRHGASPRIRGTRKRWSSTDGAAGQDLVPVEGRDGARRVGARWRRPWRGRSGATPARSSEATSAAWSSTSASCPVNSSSSSSVRCEPGQGGHVGHVVPGQTLGRSLAIRRRGVPGRRGPRRRRPPPAPRSGVRPSRGWPRGSCARDRPARRARPPTRSRTSPDSTATTWSTRLLSSRDGQRISPSRGGTASTPSNSDRAAASGVPG